MDPSTSADDTAIVKLGASMEAVTLGDSMETPAAQPGEAVSNCAMPSAPVETSSVSPPSAAAPSGWMFLSNEIKDMVFENMGFHHKIIRMRASVEVANPQQTTRISALFFGVDSAKHPLFQASRSIALEYAKYVFHHNSLWITIWREDEPKPKGQSLASLLHLNRIASTANYSAPDKILPDIFAIELRSMILQLPPDPETTADKISLLEHLLNSATNLRTLQIMMDRNCRCPKEIEYLPTWEKFRIFLPLVLDLLKKTLIQPTVEEEQFRLVSIDFTSVPSVPGFLREISDTHLPTEMLAAAGFVKVIKEARFGRGGVAEKGYGLGGRIVVKRA